jgi:L-rhamnose mutarotase
MKIRKAFVMSVHQGCEPEYETRHNPIWPELEIILRKHGVSNYSIFLHPETRQLFGYVEIESEERWTAIADSEICRKWWLYMADIMPVNTDNSPVYLPLKEVFHLQ